VRNRTRRIKKNEITFNNKKKQVDWKMLAKRGKKERLRERVIIKRSKIDLK
jgi:hypothetical protein